MKKILLMMLTLLFTLSLCGCQTKSDKNIEITSSELDPEEIINVNLDVELYEILLCEEFEYTLTQRQKKDGFISISKAEGNKAVFTIKRKDYNSFKNQLLSSRKDIFELYNEKSSDNCIVKVEYNPTITEITVTVNKNVYNPQIDISSNEYLKAYNCITGCGRNATLYHMYSLGETEKCIVTVKDYTSGSVIQTLTYPNMLYNN